jgi:hypothetical protein
MNSLSYPIYRDFSEQNQVFSGMFCRHSLPFSVSFQGRSERVAGELVSGTYFPVLGLHASLGRLFDSTERSHASTGTAYASPSFITSPARMVQNNTYPGLQEIRDRGCHRLYARTLATAFGLEARRVRGQGNASALRFRPARRSNLVRRLPGDTITLITR